MSDISRSTVSIRLFGAELNPEQVTQLLGCLPSSAAKTGETIIRSNGKERIVSKGFWLLEHGRTDESGVEEKIEFLLAKLTDNLEAWKSVTKDLDRADIFCGLFIDKLNEGFKLSQSVLKKISDRNLEVSFDIYSPTDGWYGDNEESEAMEGS
jgi:hypothetical protein